MNLRSISASERRTLGYSAAVIVLALGYTYGVRPYRSALSDTKALLAADRAVLARDRAAVAGSSADPAVRRTLDSALAVMTPRLFVGRDEVAASADLSSYLNAVAHSSHVLVQSAATRPALVSKTGVRTLRVEMRMESDLRGALSFLSALDHGPRLIRVERFEVSRPNNSDDESEIETLTISATIDGYAIGDPPPPGRGRGGASLPATPPTARGGL